MDLPYDGQQLTDLDLNASALEPFIRKDDMLVVNGISGTWRCVHWTFLRPELCVHVKDAARPKFAAEPTFPM